MNIAQYGKALVKKAFELGGFELRRKGTGEAPTLSAALKRLAGRKVAFNSVIDVGASNGCWSAGLMKHYPDAGYLLIEAQSTHEADLKQFCRQHPNARYVLAAAGAEESEIFFDATDPFGGVASYQPTKGQCIRVPVTTVDAQLQKHNLSPPYLLKLDTHGFEIPIFSGAAGCLAQTEVIIVECYNFKIAPEAVLFHEMCAFLGRSGFRCMDLYDPLYRPRDRAFWQMDLLFMKDQRQEFSHLEYR